VPPGKADNNKVRWIMSVSEYTLAGIVASVLVAIALTWTGRMLVGHGMRPLAAVAALAVGLISIARSFGWRYAMLPRTHRQTPGMWARRFSARVARILWGFDLGLVVTTRTTSPGAAFLGATTIAISSSWLAVFLFPAYWIGRSLPIWLGPLVLTSPSSTETALDELRQQTTLFTWLNQLTLVWITIWLLMSQGIFAPI
jgi:hypothetical protein